MVIEICVAIATGVFLILAGFGVMALLSLMTTLKQARSFLSHTQREMKVLTEESLQVIKNVNETVEGIKKKSESLNILFKPLFALTKHTPSKKKVFSEKSAQLLDWANIAIDFYKKVKKDR